MPVHELDRKIVNRLQIGFPICEKPFLAVAKELRVKEDWLVERVRALLDDGTLTRFGPMYDAKSLGGNFSLCAMTVDEDDFDIVAEKVNAFPEVAHNYKRDHRLNMWFVLATEKPSGIKKSVKAIEAATGCRVLNLPKLQEFFVGLHFKV